MFRTICCASAAVAFGAISAPAVADNIGTGVWYAFAFASSGSALTGGGVPGTNPSGVSAPTGPWIITLSRPTPLTVVDVEASGDQFTLYDNGKVLGETSTPSFGSYVGECISCALADPNFSRGYFTLPAGKNVISGVFDTGFGFGDGDFGVAVGVPEPASWALMLVGLGGLGVATRLRSHRSNQSRSSTRDNAA
ncbi:MAG: PEPxxWA-CTERM sorting domain-containing protein [Caulobacteraceae bacterium]|nr:PEPxxWA-CTERM sorting domain-containing protein [Caulobacteraceae bacterium]